jgi:N-acetylmuramoyl-L-alanine amidase
MIPPPQIFMRSAFPARSHATAASPGTVACYRSGIAGALLAAWMLLLAINILLLLVGCFLDPLSAILGDLANTEHLVDSDEFARLTHARLAAIDPVPSRGVKQAPFVVLMGVRMPAALVEIGFITNPKEARGLAAGERQGEIADAIAAAVLEFGRRYDARRGAGAAAAVPEPARPPARGEGDS